MFQLFRKTDLSPKIVMYATGMASISPTTPTGNINATPAVASMDL